MTAAKAVIPPHIAADPVKLAQHLKVLQQLAEMGVPAEQWPTVMQALEQQSATPAPNPTAYGGAMGSTQRARSRSPNGRRSPTYGNYRQRSPIRGNDASMQIGMTSLPSGYNNAAQKWTDYDPTLPNNHIKGMIQL